MFLNPFTNSEPVHSPYFRGRLVGHVPFFSVWMYIFKLCHFNINRLLHPNKNRLIILSVTNENKQLPINTECFYVHLSFQILPWCSAKTRTVLHRMKKSIKYIEIPFKSRKSRIALLFTVIVSYKYFSTVLESRSATFLKNINAVLHAYFMLTPLLCQSKKI